MKKITVSNLITIDSFFAGPHGEIDWHNYDDEMSAYSMRMMKSLSSMIFGKTTYELMESFWPTPEGLISEPVVAQIMNTIPKVVFSKTMTEVTDRGNWKNVTVLDEIKVDEIIKMKDQSEGDIAILGSGTVVQQFTNLGLIDEYRLIINPLILANGKPLFKEVKTRHDLKLLDTKVFKNGNVLLCYEPMKN